MTSGVVGYKIYRVGTTKAITSTTKLSLHVKRVKGARYYVRASTRPATWARAPRT